MMVKRMKQRMGEESGFTLAELLIVVAIIAVLVAISIPVFNSQLEKSRDATDQANLRAAYAEAVAAYMTNEPVTEAASGYTYNPDKTNGGGTFTKTVPQKGTNNKWGDGEEFKIGNKAITPAAAKADAKLTLTFDKDGNISSVTWN